MKRLIQKITKLLLTLVLASFLSGSLFECQATQAQSNVVPVQVIELLNIPDEMIKHVLSFCSPAEIMQRREVCSKSRDIVDNNFTHLLLSKNHRQSMLFEQLRSIIVRFPKLTHLNLDG